MATHIDDIYNLLQDTLLLQVNLLRDIHGELVKLTSKKEKKKEERLPSTDLPPLAFIWNQWSNSNLPKVQTMNTSGNRYKSAVQRWKEHPDDNYWIHVIIKINESKFCNGENERHWFADFEFFIRPDTPAKVLEGKYDDKKIGHKKVFYGKWLNPDTGKEEELWK